MQLLKFNLLTFFILKESTNDNQADVDDNSTEDDGANDSNQENDSKENDNDDDGDDSQESDNDEKDSPAVAEEDQVCMIHVQCLFCYRHNCSFMFGIQFFFAHRTQKRTMIEMGNILKSKVTIPIQVKSPRMTKMTMMMTMTTITMMAHQRKRMTTIALNRQLMIAPKMMIKMMIAKKMMMQSQPLVSIA